MRSIVWNGATLTVAAFLLMGCSSGNGGLTLPTISTEAVSLAGTQAVADGAFGAQGGADATFEAASDPMSQEFLATDTVGGPQVSGEIVCPNVFFDIEINRLTLDYNGCPDRGGLITIDLLAPGDFLMTFMDDFFMGATDIDGIVRIIREENGDYTLSTEDGDGVPTEVLVTPNGVLAGVTTTTRVTFSGAVMGVDTETGAVSLTGMGTATGSAATVDFYWGGPNLDDPLMREAGCVCPISGTLAIGATLSVDSLSADLSGHALGVQCDFPPTGGGMLAYHFMQPCGTYMRDIVVDLEGATQIDCFIPAETICPLIETIPDEEVSMAVKEALCGPDGKITQDGGVDLTITLVQIEAAATEALSTQIPNGPCAIQPN